MGALGCTRVGVGSSPAAGDSASPPRVLAIPSARPGPVRSSGLRPRQMSTRSGPARSDPARSVGIGPASWANVGPKTLLHTSVVGRVPAASCLARIRVASQVIRFSRSRAHHAGAVRGTPGTRSKRVECTSEALGAEACTSKRRSRPQGRKGAGHAMDSSLRLQRAQARSCHGACHGGSGHAMAAGKRGVSSACRPAPRVRASVGPIMLQHTSVGGRGPAASSEGSESLRRPSDSA